MIKVSPLVFVGVIVVALVTLTLTPLAIIWALNTLFPSLAIAYTFETWLAALVMYLVSKQTLSIKRD